MIHCREVLIKFMDRNKNGQRFMHTEVPGCYTLEVTSTEHHVRVAYMRKDEATGLAAIKVVIFNLTNVDELTCENTVVEL